MWRHCLLVTSALVNAEAPEGEETVCQMCMTSSRVCAGELVVAEVLLEHLAALERY